MPFLAFELCSTCESYQELNTQAARAAAIASNASRLGCQHVAVGPGENTRCIIKRQSAEQDANGGGILRRPALTASDYYYSSIYISDSLTSSLSSGFLI